MLPSLRQATCGVVARLIPRQAYAVGLHTSSKVCQSPGDDALRDEALRALEPATGPTAVTATEASQQRPNYDVMHHYIPPAQSPILQLFTTLMMKSGKYASAAKQTSQLLLHIYAMTRSKPMPIIEKAVLLASPSVRLRKQKQGGGKTILKPMALSERQRTMLGIKWLIDAADAKGNPGKSRAERLAKEIITTLKGDGTALKMKYETHKAAMVNRGNLPKRF